MSSNPIQASAPPLPIGFVEQNTLQMHPPPSADQFSEPPPPYPWAEAQLPKTANSPPPQYQGPPPSAYPPLPNQHYPSASANQYQYQQHQHQYVSPPPPTMHINVHQVLQGNCRHCHVGTVVDQSDRCCVICLIVMTILTLPFGLFFLCCLACAVEKRCNVCHRLQ